MCCNTYLVNFATSHNIYTSYEKIVLYMCYLPSFTGKCLGWVCLDQLPLKCMWYRAFPQAQHVLGGSPTAVPSPSGAVITGTI